MKYSNIKDKYTFNDHSCYEFLTFLPFFFDCLKFDRTINTILYSKN